MKILLAEDERTISRLIRQVLVNNGHEVTAVTSAAEAVALLESERFDLVLLDLHLADGDGMRVVAAIETQQGEGRPPVVLMTGEGVLGADDPRTRRVATVLAKPFDLDELERAVNAFVA
ncbi:response regulator [Tepidiforma sp.]|uniref:response regulator n=1 Tax=Tepidiforma sp. TaxID=2682230 RepID=UPI002ADD4A85|nr:response regulator [Tepidiforma sp.]